MKLLPNEFIRSTAEVTNRRNSEFPSPATMCIVGSVHLPGDVLRELKQSESSGKTVLGPGLKKESGEVRVIKAGILRYKEPNVYWIDCHQKRVRSGEVSSNL